MCRVVGISLSPDGRWAAVGVSNYDMEPNKSSADVWLLPTEPAKGAPRQLTTHEARDGGPLWSPDGRTLLFLSKREGDKATQIYLIEPTGGEPVVGGGTLTDFDLSTDGKPLAFVRTTMSTPGRACAAAADGKNVCRLETFNDSLTAQWQLGETQERTFEGWGKNPVQMWIVYPPGFDPGKKWPLLQMVHGGPHSAVLDQFHYRWNMHLLASRGHVVVAVNFHGSTGWGPEFTDANTADYGTKELFDIEKGTDLMLATGSIDAQRLAAAGGSFGGYMVAWMNGHTERYKAYVCHAGVFDWVPQQAASDVSTGRDRALGGFYWENPETVHQQSARAHAARFKTPTLVIHGERDYRVPLTQGLAYYGTLRNAGVPARLVVFEDENHWIGKPQSSRLWHEEVFAWLERYAPGGGR